MFLDGYAFDAFLVFAACRITIGPVAYTTPTYTPPFCSGYRGAEISHCGWLCVHLGSGLPPGPLGLPVAVVRAGVAPSPGPPPSSELTVETLLSGESFSRFHSLPGRALFLLELHLYVRPTQDHCLFKLCGFRTMTVPTKSKSLHSITETRV